MKHLLKHHTLTATLALPVFAASAGTSMANLALPAIATEFSLSILNARWIVLCYLLAITIFSLAVGRLGDLSGRRFTLLLGNVLFTTGAFVSALSSSFHVLIFGRVLQGMGGAALTVLPIAIATDVLPNKKIGRSMGLFASMSAFGTATGPLIGGFLIGAFGWRSIFTAMTLSGFIVVLFILKFVHHNRSPGAITQKKFISSLQFFYSDTPLRMYLLSNFAISAIMMSALISGPLYLTHALKLDSYHVGLVMSAGPITSILSGTFAGFAVDRFGGRFVIALGFSELLMGSISFVFLPSHFGALGFVISAVLLSLGYQLFLSANSTNLMKEAGSTQRGLASGALNLSRNIGLILGTYFVGSIFSFFTEGTTDSLLAKEATLLALQSIFVIAAILITFLLSVQLKQEMRSPLEERFANEVY